MSSPLSWISDRSATVGLKLLVSLDGIGQVFGLGDDLMAQSLEQVFQQIPSNGAIIHHIIRRPIDGWKFKSYCRNTQAPGASCPRPLSDRARPLAPGVPPFSPGAAYGLASARLKYLRRESAFQEDCDDVKRASGRVAALLRGQRADSHGAAKGIGFQGCGRRPLALDDGAARQTK